MNDEQIRLQICFLISSEQANLSDNFVIWRTLDGITQIEPTKKWTPLSKIMRPIPIICGGGDGKACFPALHGRRYHLASERRLRLSGSITTTVFEYQEEE